MDEGGEPLALSVQLEAALYMCAREKPRSFYLQDLFVHPLQRSMQTNWSRFLSMESTLILLSHSPEHSGA